MTETRQKGAEAKPQANIHNAEDQHNIQPQSNDDSLALETGTNFNTDLCIPDYSSISGMQQAA